MKIRLVLVAGLIGFWSVGAPLVARAAVVVVANRSERKVTFTVTTAGGQAQPYAVASGDLVAVPVAGAVGIAFDSGKARRHYRLGANSACYFADFPGGLDLEQIGLSTGPQADRPPSDPVPPSPPVMPAKPRIIPVKILVDEEERNVRRIWEARLRRRIEWASDILEHHCHVRLQVVAAEEWQSDNTLTDVPGLLADFERKVKPQPARLAIGFTSQRLKPEGEKRAGVTRVALHDHILLREGWPLDEATRLEVLLHELGHYLGAAHSPEPDSVMRAVLGGRPKGRRSRSPGFDPLNTLVMNLVAEEVYDHGARHLGDFRPAVRQRLREVYSALGRALPEDPTPPQYLRLLDRSAGPRSRVGPGGAALLFPDLTLPQPPLAVPSRPRGHD